MSCKPWGTRALAVASIVTVCLATITLAGDESYEYDRQRLENMSATEKESLRQQQQRFERLPLTEREKLRQLDSAIAEDAAANRLRQVMRSYHEWLRALPSSQRVELLSLPTAERVERIKILLAEQERERFQELFGSKLQPDDQRVLRDWVHALIERDEARIMRQLAPLDRQRLLHIEDVRQRRATMTMMYRRNSGDTRLFELLQPTATDLKQLSTTLSPLARDTLAAARDEKEREQLIQMWARAVIDSHARPQVAKDEIQQFLDEHVTDEQRAYLETLPRDRMRMELQRMYVQYRFKGVPLRPGPRKGIEAK
ncbi:MAG: hypothetical protein HYV60_21260 [Planctomycetia bacterium]|nr:hypothetical protein [Planctomycetia bacterium]